MISYGQKLTGVYQVAAQPVLVHKPIYRNTVSSCQFTQSIPGLHLYSYGAGVARRIYLVSILFVVDIYFHTELVCGKGCRNVDALSDNLRRCIRPYVFAVYLHRVVIQIENKLRIASRYGIRQPVAVEP